MKALTLHQPWASLVAEGVKTIETRSWSTKYRGQLAIHAGKTKANVMETGPEIWAPFIDPDRPGRLVHPMNFGAVVAVAQLVDVLPIVDDLHDEMAGRFVFDTHVVKTGAGNFIHLDARVLADVTVRNGWFDVRTNRSLELQRPYGDFAPGRFAWILEEVTAIHPVPAKGRQGLWNWEGK